MKAIALVGVLGAMLAAPQAQRDRVREPSGTASVSGVVTTDDQAAAPIRRALVTLLGGDLLLPRTAITDDDGRFDIVNLPAGRMTLSASKPSFVTTSFGARKPGRPGTAISVAAGQRVSDVALRMPRGAVISGSVRDAAGAPMAGLQIAIVAAPRDLIESVTPTTTLITDDRGAYRAYGLVPGTYVVMASSPSFTTNSTISTLTDAEVEAALSELQRGRTGSPMPSAPRPPAPAAPPRTVGFAPVFYPGTSVFTEAGRIELAAGEIRTGMDFAFSMTPTTTIDVTVTNPYGSLPPLMIALNPTSMMRLRFSREVRPAAMPQITTVSPGHFKYTNVAPGQYTIAVRTATAVPTPGAPLRPGPLRALSNQPSLLWGAAHVFVTGADLAPIAVALQPTLHLMGRVEFDGATLQPPLDLTSLSVRLISTTSAGSSSINNTQYGSIAPSPGQVRPDGSFDVGGILPDFFAVSSVPPAGWVLRSAMSKNLDLLDVAADFTSGRDVTDVVLTYSDRHSELTGMIQTAAGLPAPDYFVVVFPANKDLWRPKSRRVQSARPGTDGVYVMRDLPAGDYLLAALTDVAPGDLNDPMFLEALVNASVKVSLAEGDTRRKDVRIAKAP